MMFLYSIHIWFVIAVAAIFILCNFFLFHYALQYTSFIFASIFCYDFSLCAFFYSLLSSFALSILATAADADAFFISGQ